MDTTTPPQPGTASAAGAALPAIEGWFTTGPDPRLIGARCSDCGTYAFPPHAGPCPNPDCVGEHLDPVELSSRGRVWSYTENHYPPPPPFPQRQAFEPYAVAAVELEAEGLVVLGQVVPGVTADDLALGLPMKLALDVLYTDDDGVDRLVWAWMPDNDIEEA